MSSTTGTTRAKGIQKRLIAQEVAEIVNVTVDTTLSELHVDAILVVTSGTGKTVTFPQDSANTKILIGHSGRIKQGGAGALTFTAGAGATVNQPIAGLAAINKYAHWVKIAANTYDITGNAIS